MLFLGLTCNELWTSKQFLTLLMDCLAILGPDSTATFLTFLIFTTAH